MSASGKVSSALSVQHGEGFRTPANQAVVWHEAGVRKPPMHEPAGRGRCYGDLENLLFRGGGRGGRWGCGGGGTAAVVGAAAVMRRRMAASDGETGLWACHRPAVMASDGPI